MKIVLLITAAALVLIAVKWAFLPGRRLPRHRVRHLRIRLRLRLHPGKGHATIAELWWRWGRLAINRSSRRTRPGLTGRLLAHAREKSVLTGRGHFRHALRLPLDEHAVIFSPPRGGKTGWLARVILHYPGPVLSTTTKHDVFELTAAVRARSGPLHVFNPQGIGAVASTFRWNPLASIHRVNSDDRFCGGRARRADLEGKGGVVYLPLTFLRLVRGSVPGIVGWLASGRGELRDAVTGSGLVRPRRRAARRRRRTGSSIRSRGASLRAGAR